MSDFLDGLLRDAPANIRNQAKKLDLSKVESWNDTVPFIVFLDSLLDWKGANQNIIKYINEKQKLLKDFAALKQAWLKTEAEQEGLKELNKTLKAYKIFKEEARKRLSDKDYEAIMATLRRRSHMDAGN